MNAVKDEKTATARLYIPSNEVAIELYGPRETYLKRLESLYGVKLTARGNELVVSGGQEVVDRVYGILEALLATGGEKGGFSAAQVDYTLDILENDSSADIEAVFADTISVPSRRRFVRPRTAGQRGYINAIRKNTITFSIGPAGTGKTYLAMALAIEALMREEVRRLVLARPAVEAGESLGFLPGDFTEKVSPYLRPLYDALHDMMEFDRATRLINRGVVEVVPLAYMRGRTLNESFVILDEAQNTTFEQMKMFLTRLGYGSKAVVTGDITQIDLPENRSSGLVEIQYILKGVDGIGFAYLTKKDVVRHRIIQGIVEAYETYEKEHKINEDSRRRKSSSGADR
ncbi:MAG: PhoH family protein [bacterium]|nr:PhoH family protein [bacterium]